MQALEVDQPILDAHRLLVRRGAIEPLSSKASEVERWLTWELASLVEGHFHTMLDLSAPSTAVLQQWQQRLADSGDHLRDPRSDEFRRVYWLLLDGVSFDGSSARFSVQLTDTWIPLIEAENCGASLGWTELAAYPPLHESSVELHRRAPSTFALHLAVRGWPLIRSAELWERRYDWCDVGMPEGLAYRIALFESIAHESRYEIRTPNIPGLDYDAD